MGRGKIEIQKIENEAGRQVTFAKRKKGLIKKAQELSVLCDAAIGVLVFPDHNTARIHEFASNGTMKELMERYDNIKGNDDPQNPAAEAKLWKLEAYNLRQQVEDLKGSLRHLMGEDLLELRSEELCSLESTLDTSITMARQRKDQISKDRMLQLNQQGSQVQEENVQLERQLGFMRQQVAQLHMKVAVEQEKTGGGGHVSSVGQASSSWSSHNAYTTLTELQLMPPIPDVYMK